MSQLATETLQNTGVYCGPHESDFDTNGVLHLLGTAFGTRRWELSNIASRVSVSTSEGNSSGVQSDVHPLLHADLSEKVLEPKWNNALVLFLDRTEGHRIFTNQGIGAWFQVDLGPFLSVIATAYTLRHNSTQGRALRNFTVMGSNDESLWEVLGEHRSDERLGVHCGSSCTWNVDNGRAREPGRIRKAYRYFRITKVGPDTDAYQPSDYMHLSGFEVYGWLQIQGRGV